LPCENCGRSGFRGSDLSRFFRPFAGETVQLSETSAQQEITSPRILRDDSELGVDGDNAQAFGSFSPRAGPIPRGEPQNGHYPGVAVATAARGLRAVIEIPRTEPKKFEYDKQLQRFQLDRICTPPVHYRPVTTGFIPLHAERDGDALDGCWCSVPGPSFPVGVQEVRSHRPARDDGPGHSGRKVLAVGKKQSPLRNIWNSPGIYPPPC